MLLKSSSFLLAALCLVAPHFYAVKAQITAVASQKVDRTGWTISADSAQSGNPATNAIDGLTTTFWHSEYSPVLTLLPHNITIDMKNQYMVNGLAYLPRQDKFTNGNVGQHTIALSVDGITWTTSSSGTWPNDKTLKTTYFSPQPARYVRLSAQTEASGRNLQFMSAAELNVFTNPQATLSRAKWVVSADSQVNGINSYNATEAIDGADTTYWQTQTTGGTLPHYYTIDQGSAVVVGGLTYLPRPWSTGGQGRVGSYQVQRSTDGSTWTTIATGAWPDSQSLKTVEFAAVSSRFIRLVALTEAGNRGPYTSAAEINLLDGSTQLANFKVTVDSQEITAFNGSGTNAMDGDISTVWHTQYSIAPPAPFPHYITIDMQSQFYVHALNYTPRTGSANGRIGNHQIDLSTDGATWTTVAKGSWFDSADPKHVMFEESVARFVRLTATSEAGNRGPWSNAAEIILSFDSSYTPPPNSLGQWGQVIDFPIVPVAAAVIPTTGKVLTWSSYAPNAFVGGTGKTYTSSYDIATGVVSEVLVTNTDHDMFCPGLSLDFNGRPFVTGGNDAYRTSIYDPPTDTWSVAPDMEISRGYQSSQTLSDGRIFTIGGSWSGGVGGKNGEVFSVANNSWSLLPGCPVAPMLTQDKGGVYRADNHGWLFAWKNATVFQAGPSVAMNWYTPTGYGGVQAAGSRTGDTDSMCGVAVMYDAVAGKIFTAGGATSYEGAASTSNAHIISIGAPNTTAAVTPLGNMAYRRVFHNSVVLPDGTVFIVGGQEYSHPFFDDDSIFYPELWNPTTGLFKTLAPMATPRNYHSIALLMPDATIISGGGGLCKGCSMNHFDAQIFSPPYLFTAAGTLATRPVINSVSSSNVTVGSSLTVSTSGLVSSFALIRVGSATHTVNTDQRRIPLTPVLTGVNQYSIVVPSDPGIALPGYWMLFAIDAFGVPSVATTIKISPTVAVLKRSFPVTPSRVVRRTL